MNAVFTEPLFPCFCDRVKGRFVSRKNLGKEGAADDTPGGDDKVDEEQSDYETDDDSIAQATNKTPKTPSVKKITAIPPHQLPLPISLTPHSSIHFPSSHHNIHHPPHHSITMGGVGIGLPPPSLSSSHTTHHMNMGGVNIGMSLAGVGAAGGLGGLNY